MPDLNTAALEALGRTIYSSERYGSDHRVAIDAAHRAAHLLSRAVHGNNDLVIVFSEDRIVVGAAIINDPRVVASSIGASLRSRGCQTVRVRRGVGLDDVLALCRDLLQRQHVEPEGTIGTPRLSAGVIADSGQQRRQSGAVLARLCAPVADLHAGIVHENRIKSAELENIAEAVLCSFTSQSSAVLELVEIENHDQYTMAHSVNVSVLAGALARSVGIAESAVEKAVIAALLHDIGKREIPSSILLKNGPLSDQERRVVLDHPAAGARMLLGRDDIPLLASVVAYEHHRRLDRRGYPEPASATTPGIASQIVQIADIYDALRSNRPYRSGMSTNEVLEIMSNDAGKAYDRALFEIFVDRVLIRTDHNRGGVDRGVAA